MDIVYVTGIFLALCCVASTGRAEEVCYGDLGCFTDEGCHGTGFPPESPDFINTRFYLYTRRSWNAPEELLRGDIDGIRASLFDAKKKTKFSIHGWNSNSFGSGERDRKNAYLEMEDLNFISVDWRRGASGILYWKQHQNTRVVGREVAKFAQFLNLERGMYYKDVHLFGHSLGAHAAGYAGASQQGLGRITGSDPAGPLYRKDEPECRLDPTDALFVDVIHGDGNDNIGLGTSLPMGHQDFYPNGGRHQPACSIGSDLGGCSHAYSSRYFTESIRSTTCEFKAYPCPSLVAYLSGLCQTCGVQGCAVMGYPAEKHKELSGLFFLETNSQAPYCLPANDAEEVCFDDVGCFTDDACHAIGFPPQSPDDIDTRFYLFTRSNQLEPDELSRHDVNGLRASNFDPKRKTKFSIHGYFSTGLNSGELDRKDAFLEVEDANVIIVDWNAGAAGLYSKCHQNTRVVGREIGLLARFLNIQAGMYYKDVHVIGMSLGAHAAGYAGEFQPGFGRITGLDPAGPYFRDEGFEFRDNGPECRLDPTDAIFVDVIHTDGNDITGLGQLLQLGHQDFYPNGGRSQPGCDGADLFSGCSHKRAFWFFTESIRSTSCSFTAYPCDSWRQFALGNCGECGMRGCAIMGYHANENTAVTGTFYLETNGESPYCMSV